MKQMENKVGFKSVPKFWKVEKNGMKPNTIRWVSHDEFELLKDERPAIVEIENTKTHEVFERRVSHFLCVGGEISTICVLISWYHEEDEVER